MFCLARTLSDHLTRDEERKLAVELRQEIATVASAGGALDLRLGRLLAWFKHQNLTPMGFSSFGSFCEEHVEWGSTWIRNLIRLSESELSIVKQAANHGVIPLTTAVRAAREAGEDEVGWLEMALQKRLRRKSHRKEELQVAWIGPEVEPICKARHLARLLIGHDVSPKVADRYVREAWEQKRPLERMIAAAREVPPAPEQDTLPKWGGDDLATPLVGPWRTPNSLKDGMKALDSLQKQRRQRIVRLGELYKTIREGHWLWQMGFDSRGDLALCLGLSVRSLQRYALLADAFEMYPEMGTAYQDGMDLTRLEVISSIAEESTAARWLVVARRVGVSELRRAVDWAGKEGAQKVLAAYEEAMDQATGSVALRESQKREERPKVVFAHPLQAKAARWFLQEVFVDKRYGFGKVVERDDHRCQNPRCGARNLRTQAHHVVFRRDGGDDSEENGICLCKSCHLRLVHAGWASVKKVGHTLVWDYADGERVTVF